MKFSGFFQIFLALAVLIGLAACGAAPKGKTYLVNIDDKGLILDGYDPVAFFTDSKPVKGNSAIRTTWHDAVYQFASDEHKKMFDANPEKYAPAYGGYCGYAVSQGHLAPISVDFWEIRDGRLILQNNKRAFDLWLKDSLSLQKAEKYWPELLSRNGKPFIPKEEKTGLVNRDADGLVAGGYDVVSYVTANKAEKGISEHTKLQGGGLYLFTSNDKKQMFSAEPDKYAPLYGAYCAFAMAQGKLAPVNPEIFLVSGGSLFLFNTAEDRDQFSKDVAGLKAKADANWTMFKSKYPNGKDGYGE